MKRRLVHPAISAFLARAGAKGGSKVTRRKAKSAALNGCAPVKPGSRPRGRPKNVAVPPGSERSSEIAIPCECGDELWLTEASVILIRSGKVHHYSCPECGRACTVDRQSLVGR